MKKMPSKTATAIIPNDQEMVRNSHMELMKAKTGPISLEITTYPPPERGIAAISIENAKTESRMAIPPTMNAMIIGGMPATQRFSGSGAFPVNWKTRFCQPRPIVLHRMMSIAVSMPTSLTSPVAFRANSFFSDIFLRDMLGGDVYLTLYNGEGSYHIRYGSCMY